MSFDRWIKMWCKKKNKKTKQKRCGGVCVYIYTHTHIYTYNGILLSHKKEHIWVTCEVDEPRACYTEWSKSEKNKYSISSVTQSCLTLRPHGLQHTRLPCPSPTPGAYSNSSPSSWWCHLKADIWNLEIWYWWALQRRIGDTDVENTVREGESRTNGESNINIYTLSGVRWVAGKKLCSIGSPVWCSVMTWRDGMWGGEGMDV